MANILTIISNESIFIDKEIFYCDNIDLKSIPEGLSENYEVINIGRKSKVKRSFEINLKRTIVASNIFEFLFNIFKTFKKKDAKYLLISISPYTFVASLLLIIFRKKFFVYIRSSGYEEYKHIIGFFGPFIYHVMFTIVSWKANLISCNSRLLYGKLGKIVTPSQLNNKWFRSHQKPNLNKIELLYVGRIKVEKGIFSLLKIFKDLNKNIHLTIVGTGKGNNIPNIKQENVTVIDFENKNDSIIKIYDSHNIFILPSFTEGYSQVVDESLSRHRPVIIFKEISHIAYSNRRGVFVSERNSTSLSQTINHIMDNYHLIEKKIMQNTYSTKENFLKEMSNIVSEN
jgi:glycosyltransferase involved in cell wall biosynthesis